MCNGMYNVTAVVTLFFMLTLWCRWRSRRSFSGLKYSSDFIDWKISAIERENLAEFISIIYEIYKKDFNEIAEVVPVPNLDKGEGRR